ncbi:MlaE family ABC transporter permease [Larkinella arboricola]|uniref:Phospholipid/cholesterol/gamma-HCH transport system permease protein n=1 Tax=Larkinella arboricola TaxID=643671 RepID=A0A327WW51_LARAB|nr:ABC transporter permease [Larkinella arboricola]RAJ97541.1 phospholipid/cholesterol/gamma-HCH transport system permease protein [Larkinella arboricola]
MHYLGRYFIFLGSLFRNREKFGVYTKLVLDECIQIGINSVFIVSIVSTFIGAVTCVQTAYNMVSPFVPTYIISLIVRDMTVLELAPTITCVVLSGKVGSNIASGLGTMRITEQIDALEVMGINSSSYLILPKVLASMITFPMLVILSGFLSIYGGYIAGTLAKLITSEEYIYGLRSDFNPFNITFALIKSIVFAFLISTISSFKGYYTSGGALEVGQASTAAVTNSCIAVLAADFLLAQLLL